MILLITFAFIAGIVTILSPCILPVLPIVMSGGLTGNKLRPLGIVLGFISSFTFFTLFLSTIVKATGLSADALRGLSVFVILIFGLSLIVPKFQEIVERLFSKLAGTVPKGGTSNGFVGGLIVGLSLGLVWTPCVGPILASIITLSASSNINFGSFFITFAYSLGTAIPMFAVMVGGGKLLTKVPALVRNSINIQRAFGVLMIVTAIAIYFNLDRTFQAYILNKFPNYGTGLTSIEDNSSVRNALEKLGQRKDTIEDLGSAFYPKAPELIEGGIWFNSKPLRISDLKGKVVLVDFWTYTCINCIRTLPYLRSWHDKYKDKGLVIIGVHTPEFEFEKNPDNVAKAIADFGLKYPVMQDNDYATWRVYNNRYWPAKYFIDKNGKIRSTHFGEGEYDESEKLIQDLLKEAGRLNEDMPIRNEDYDIESRTPETYLGYGRIDNFSSPETIKENSKSTYSIPKNLGQNRFAYGGEWLVKNERAEPVKNATLVFNYESKNVFLVMGSKNKKKGSLRIYLDNKLINTIEVDDYRLYDIVKSSQPGKHNLRLEFDDANLELYAFTFG